MPELTTECPQVWDVGPPSSYRALLGTGPKETCDERGLPRIMVADAVEVVCTWPGVTFENVFDRSTVCGGSRGLRLAALEDVLAFKVISAREKDQREADIIRRSLPAPMGPAAVALTKRGMETPKEEGGP